MRKTKRVVSLLITVAMMLTMVLPMTVSASFTDVPADHNYYDAITNLSAEGILDGMGDGTFAPESPVTRAQFTKIICYALSVGDITYSEEERSIFTDLAPNHWAANNIVQAYKQGIINGMGDGTFAPEAGVQYEQAVKMVVCALGYGNRALSLGAYPNGYMSMANQLKILNGITDAKMYQVMNRGAVAQLIDNMLDAEQLQDGQPGGSIRDEVSTTQKAEGRVVASKNIALYADYDNPCGNNEIAVEVGTRTVVFDISEIKNFDINKFLGRSVTVHYEKDSGSSYLIATSIALQSRKNEEVTINFDLIESYGSGEIEYYTSNDRDKTEIVTYGATANIFNGAPTETGLEDLLDENIGKPGTITLISSSRGVADVAFIKSYTTIIVNSVSAKDNKIYSVNDASTRSGFVLNVESRTKSISIKTKSGSAISVGSIAAGSVLSIAASDTEGATVKERIENSSVVEVLVCTETVRGTIEATSSNPTTIRINGKDYVVSDGVYSDVPDPDAFKAGTYISVGFDAFGQVAKYLVTEKSSLNYGYISQVEYGSYTDPWVKVMVYKPSTSPKNNPSSTIYTLTRRVDIDGTRYDMEEDMEDIVDYLDDTADYVNADFDSDITPSRDTYAQPIRFTTSGSNVIDKIITVEGTVGGPIASSLLMRDYTDGDGIGCVVDGTTLGQYRISGVPVLYIPADRKSADYQTMNSNFFKKDKNYFVQLMNINSNTNVVGAIYLYGDTEGGDIASDITEDSKPMIVVAKGTRDENGTEKSYIRLKNIVTGAEDDYYNEGLLGTEALNTLVVGDVIRISADGENTIEKVQVVAIAAQVAAGTYGTTVDNWIIEDGDGEGLTADFRILIGTVRTKEGNNFTIVPGYNTSDTTYVESHEASVIPYIVDTDANENIRIDTGIVSDLQVGANASRVLIYMEENVIKAIIIFE